MSKKNKVIKIIIACITGFINGFLGGGGGLIGVLALKKVYKLETKNAHATTIAIILPISIISSAIYLFNNTFNVEILVAISLGVIVGGTFGALFFKKLDKNVITWIFNIILFTVGVKMIMS